MEALLAFSLWPFNCSPADRTRSHFTPLSVWVSLPLEYILVAFLFRGLFWPEKERLLRALKFPVQNETSCLLLCYVLTFGVKYFNHHCCIPWIRSFNLPIFLYLFFYLSFFIFCQSKDYLAYRKSRAHLISWGSRSVSCQFCCGQGSFHSYMLLSVARYCVLLPCWKWNGLSLCA